MTCATLVGLFLLLMIYVFSSVAIAVRFGPAAAIGWAILLGFGFWWWRKKAHAILSKREEDLRGLPPKTPRGNTEE
jgi:hypothetical protein